MADDLRAPRLLAAEKEAFRDIEAAATQAHFGRLRTGSTERAEASALHLDVLRDLKQVNAHLVAAAAYPVLKSQGGLLPSRLRLEEQVMPGIVHANRRMISARPASSTSSAASAISNHIVSRWLFSGQSTSCASTHIKNTWTSHSSGSPGSCLA